jgi:hypothetical protein
MAKRDVNRPLLLAAAAILALLLPGCASEPSPGPSEDVAPPTDPRPVVSRERALELIDGARTAESAIEALEARSFDFPLDAANVESLRDGGAEPEVILYLKLRANAEWRDRIAADRANAHESWFDWVMWPPEGDFFSDFAGTTSGPRPGSAPVRAGSSAGEALREALAKPPGPEPFPDAHLEPPVPRHERD